MIKCFCSKNKHKGGNPMDILTYKQLKLYSKINKFNLNAKFNDDKVTSVGNFTYLEAFKKVLDLHSLLKKGVACVKGNNSTFKTTEIIEYLIDSIILGYSRFLHIDDLRNDIGYQKIKETDRLPSEKVCRDLLKLLTEKSLSELRGVNKTLLSLKASIEEVKEICLDFDDTVVTIFGNQEGSGIGYNPRYNGRASFKEKVGFISGTDELLDVTLENGIHHSNYDFLSFFKRCLEQLPSRYILKRIRLDRGFFDENNLEFFEEQEIEYVVKCKNYPSIKKIINYINENPNDFSWKQISSQFAVTEITLPLQKWRKARRFVIVRKEEVCKNKNQIVFDEVKYTYQAIVTNIDYLTGEEIFQDYNQRCNVENKIDEIKEGFAFSENGLTNFKANEAFLIIKMIAFNLQNWFKQSILPKEVQHHEIKTLRRIFYRIPCNICGNSYYRHLSFSPNLFLKDLIMQINKQLVIFFSKFVNSTC